MKEFLAKISQSDALKNLRYILSSKYFPFFSAAVMLVCYYLGWDIVAIYYCGIIGILILLLLDDITPIISVFLFMNIMISLKHSPSYTANSSDYYFQTAILVQIIIVIAAFALTAVCRAAVTCARKKFKPTPVFYGLCALAVTFLLNGALSESYDPMNLVYGGFMAFFYLGVFVLLKDNISVSKENFEKIALCFVALSIVLVIELAVQLITNDNLVLNGSFKKTLVVFGWGIWNTMGMLLTISIPAAMYLAGKYKYGFLFLLYAMLLAVSAIHTGSRQTLVGVAITFPLSLIILLIKGKNKIINICITVVAAAVCIAVIYVNREPLKAYAELVIKQTMVDGIPLGGRLDLWKSAIENFKTSPVFGNGFYDDRIYASEMVGLKIIPLMYHNTFLQILASCGILGLIAYVVHRIQTIISFFKNITIERTFIAVTLLSLLIMSLFDNHIFYILPTLVYTGLIAFLVKSEDKENNDLANAIK